MFTDATRRKRPVNYKHYSNERGAHLHLTEKAKHDQRLRVSPLQPTPPPPSQAEIHLHSWDGSCTDLTRSSPLALHELPCHWPPAFPASDPPGFSWGLLHWSGTSAIQEVTAPSLCVIHRSSPCFSCHPPSSVTAEHFPAGFLLTQHHSSSVQSHHLSISVNAAF